MRLTSFWAGLWLISLNPCLAQNESHERHSDFQQPSLELLEFLADFGELDDETYNLIEYHALQDQATDLVEKSDE